MDLSERLEKDEGSRHSILRTAAASMATALSIQRDGGHEEAENVRLLFLCFMRQGGV